MFLERNYLGSGWWMPGSVETCECVASVFVEAGVRYSSGGMSTKPLMILNIMVSWHLIRLSSKDCHSSCSSKEVTLLLLWYLFLTYLAALRWTILSLLMYSCVYELQSVQQYSTIGLFSEKYVLVDSLLTLRFLLRKPNILLPFLLVWSMCLFQPCWIEALYPGILLNRL